MRKKVRYASVALLLLVLVAVSGCRTVGFYAQAIKGQYQIFASDQPIARLLEETNTTATLRQRFVLLGELRRFAEQELELPVDGHYLKYADLHRPFVVWNVQAAPEFSLEPKRWWYPFLGRLDYRGYFSREGATNYAAVLRDKGYDVAVGGVQAYSTLGWFKDPVLNTFIFEPDAELAEIIFHELSHQRVFVGGDTDFNEAFATTVGQEGARRWLRAKGNAKSLAEYEAYLKRNAEFVQVVMETRAKLEALYGDERDEAGKLKATERNRDVPAQQLRQEKQRLYAELKRRYEALRDKWGGGRGDYDYWFEQQVNNAHLNSISAYFDLVPGFEQILAAHGGKFQPFYEEVAALAKKPKKERHELLRNLQRSAAPPTMTGR